MNPKDNPSATLLEIRSLMERSTRFISLSGLSGVAAGIFALLGVAAVYSYLNIFPFEVERLYYVESLHAKKWGMNYQTFFMLDALLVIISAAIACTYFTARKARQKGRKIGIHDKLTRSLLVNLAVPLAAGGIFCLALFHHGYVGLLAPCTLIFYGLALLNASKFTFKDIQYLGFSELVLGLISLFQLKYGLEFWAIGFGVLHIFYGIIMYRKYD